MFELPFNDGGNNDKIGKLWVDHAVCYLRQKSFDSLYRRRNEWEKMAGILLKPFKKNTNFANLAP